MLFPPQTTAVPPSPDPASLPPKLRAAFEEHQRLAVLAAERLAHAHDLRERRDDAEQADATAAAKAIRAGKPDPG